jgi:hypothetical protein
MDPNGIHEYFIAEPAPESVPGIAGEEELDPGTSAVPQPEPKPIPRPSGPPIF